MQTQAITIESIPAMIWGHSSNKVYIFVHGKMSQKEDAEGFAGIAQQKGYQVISFDLPEHGERKRDGYRCTVQNAVRDLGIISGFAMRRWQHLSLFGSSLGAYFGLAAYQELKFNKCLFVSPVLDMENLIQNMMKSYNVTEDLLQERQEIPTPPGETISWPYYQFVREHPIVKWDSPTCILYGSEDNLTPRNVVDTFVAMFGCNLVVLQNGEHYFHTKEHLDVVDKWLNLNI